MHELRDELSTSSPFAASHHQLVSHVVTRSLDEIRRLDKNTLWPQDTATALAAVNITNFMRIPWQSLCRPASRSPMALTFTGEIPIWTCPGPSSTSTFTLRSRLRLCFLEQHRSRCSRWLKGVTQTVSVKLCSCPHLHRTAATFKHVDQHRIALMC